VPKKVVKPVPPASLAPPPAPKLPKSPLSKKELTTFRQLLLAKRATLVGDVSNMTDEALRKNGQNSGGDLSNMPIHMADLGSDNFEQEFTLGLIESESALLREIDEALQRIEDRSYGVCLGTGKPIGKTRLKAKPWAKYCIEYARRLERGF
jgi:RNA polymerase-binding protein DksA